MELTDGDKRHVREVLTLLGLLALIGAGLVMAGRSLGPSGCTVAGSTCGSGDSCPTAWVCERGRCTPPAREGGR